MKKIHRDFYPKHRLRRPNGWTGLSKIEARQQNCEVEVWKCYGKRDFYS